jgi:hypothetical protein
MTFQFSLLRILLLTLGFAMLGACGGGDSGGSPGTNPVGQQPPIVLEATYPLGMAYANSSVNVSIFREQSVLRLSNGIHAVAYYDEAGDVRIDTVDGGGRVAHSLWIEPRLERRLLADGHCAINMGRSSDGKIHVIYGAHVTMPFYAMFDESALQEGAPEHLQASLWARSITYPQFYNVGGTLQMWFRLEPDTDIHRATYVPGSGGMPLTSQPMLLQDDASLTYPYMNRLAVQGQNVALSWVYRLFSSDDLVRNEGIFLARSSDGGRTFVSKGVPLTLPAELGAVTPTLPVPDTQQPLNQTDSTYGPDGRLYLTYYAKDTQGIHQIHLAEFDPGGNLLQAGPVSDSTARFDLTGRGTLVLPLSRPQIVVSDRYIHIVYRQGETLVIASRVTQDPRAPWTYLRLNEGELGAWEPTFSRDTWAIERRLLLYVQYARQGTADTEAVGPPAQAKLYVFRESE